MFQLPLMLLGNGYCVFTNHVSASENAYKGVLTDLPKLRDGGYNGYLSEYF